MYVYTFFLKLMIGILQFLQTRSTVYVCETVFKVQSIEKLYEVFGLFLLDITKSVFQDQK